MGLPSPDQHGCAHYPRLHRSPRRPPMTIKAGDHLPEVTLQRIRDGVETLDTRTLFDNRKVVIFAVPGAFTPTCSERHLPGFVANFDEFRKRGIDVACVAVNDPFVMQAWGESQHVPERSEEHTSELQSLMRTSNA